jgi:ACS family sodium-dependent inorganic phosphate cotransporter-like MFS transporter 5
MASFVSYMLRVNFSIIIIAMTGNATEKLSGNFTDGVGEDQFNWSKKDQGLLLAAYFYGYIFPNLLGGVLSDKFGGRKVIFIGIFLSGIITGLTPFTANDNFVFTFVARLLLGVLGVR